MGQDIRYADPTEITTTLDCRKLNTPGAYQLVVVNPKPIQFDESDVSNPVNFVLTE